MVRICSTLAVCALVLASCFRDALQDSCGSPAGCPDATSTGTSTSSGATTGPPTTGSGPGTSTGTGTGTSTSTSTGGDSDTLASSTTEALPGVLLSGIAFRIETLAIADPGLYYSGLACLDATSFVNSALQKAIDDRQTNLLLVALDYDPDADLQEFLLYRDADCPADQGHCLLSEVVLPVKFIAANKDQGNCLDVELSTVNPSRIDQLNLPVAPCVSSPAASVELELSQYLDPIPLNAAKFVGQYSPGDVEPGTLTSAVLHGFVSQSDAEGIDFTFMGAPLNLWALIRGSKHPESCPIPMDGLPGSVPDVDMLDLDADGPMAPVAGVYLYLNFDASRVKVYAPF